MRQTHIFKITYIINTLDIWATCHMSHVPLPAHQVSIDLVNFLRTLYTQNINKTHEIIASVLI